MSNLDNKMTQFIARAKEVGISTTVYARRMLPMQLGSFSRLIIAGVVAAAAFTGMQKDFDARTTKSADFPTFIQRILAAESLGQTADPRPFILDDARDVDSASSLLTNSKTMQKMLDNPCKPVNKDGETKLICGYNKKHEPEVKETGATGKIWELGQTQGFTVYMASSEGNGLGLIILKDSKKPGIFLESGLMDQVEKLPHAEDKSLVLDYLVSRQIGQAQLHMNAESSKKLSEVDRDTLIDAQAVFAMQSKGLDLEDAINVSAKAFSCIEAYLSKDMDEKEAEILSQGMRDRFGVMYELIKGLTTHEEDTPDPMSST
jgi:hypothetical protein